MHCSARVIMQDEAAAVLDQGWNLGECCKQMQDAQAVFWKALLAPNGRGLHACAMECRVAAMQVCDMQMSMPTDLHATCVHPILEGQA